MRLLNNCNIFFISIFLLAACDHTAQLNSLKTDDVVVAFGDSLTFGTGVNSDESYPTVLQHIIERTVVNAGIPGETSEEGLYRLPSVLNEQHPTLVLLCTGGNDLLRRLDVKQTENNLYSMIKIIQESGAQVVLIGVPEPKLLGGVAPFYKKLAEEFTIPYEGEVLNEVLRDNNLKSDAVHANAQGYEKIAERLAEVLKESGAL